MTATLAVCLLFRVFIVTPVGCLLATTFSVRTMLRSASPRQWLAAVFDVTGQVAAKQAFRSASDWYLAKGRDTLRPSRSEGSYETPDAGRARVSLRGIRARRPVGGASPARPQDPSSRPVLPDPPSAPDAPRRSGDARRASPAAVDRGDVRRLRGGLEQRRAEAARGAGRLCRESAVRRDGAAARLPLRRAGDRATRRSGAASGHGVRQAGRAGFSAAVRAGSGLSHRVAARIRADPSAPATHSLASRRPCCSFWLSGSAELPIPAGCSLSRARRHPQNRSGPSSCCRSRT